ncbi:sensor histidine kinase [Luteimonas panaciterrae]|uniref:sensor histidine kinase n=1 Tax=Luteimonas panaciterrae TaxID=363885 RepID=UPI001CFB314E|nr:ATP-binding protein [Luteimonas panaciterrae]
MIPASSSFRFAPSILTRLGEELVPNLDQAIIELIRNAYDADASLCTIELKDVKQPGGTIVLSDDGIGMRVDDIRNGWLILGGSSKESSKLTPIRGRRTVGDKGLGRLAALRAGAKALMITRHMDENEAYAVEVDWKNFESVRVVEDVVLPITLAERDSPGTTITLTGIRRALNRAEVDRLGRSIVLLTSPFDGGSDFRVNLTAPEYPELEARVRNAYLEDAEFILRAEIRDDGTAFAEVRDWKNILLYSAEAPDWLPRQPASEAKYNAPRTIFELYNFVFNKNAFAGRSSTIGEVRQWLKLVGGVHFYHRHFRVPPYGDPGHDWLDMNLARARSPEERPSTNNSVGRVVVDDPDGILRQKTDRFGFIESEEFLEIRRFAKNALEWFARRRLRDAEARRDLEKEEMRRGPTEARADLERSITRAMPAQEQERAIRALDRMQQTFEKALKSTRDDLVLYRSLATAGTTAAVFAHEVGKPIRTIAGSQKSIRHRVKSLKPARTVERLIPALDRIVSASNRLTRFAGMQIDFLKREKRRHGAVDVNKVIHQLHDLWQPVLRDAKIVLHFEPHDVESAVMFGAEALVETIITNCLTNAVSAFEQPGARTKDRQVHLRAIAEGNTVAIEIEDNGPGISMDIADIWLPGKTTRPEGTGFGLTIAKDSALDLSGTYAASNTPDGGAKFRFVFPLMSNYS